MIYVISRIQSIRLLKLAARMNPIFLVKDLVINASTCPLMSFRTGWDSEISGSPQNPLPETHVRPHNSLIFSTSFFSWLINYQAKERGELRETTRRDDIDIEDRLGVCYLLLSFLILVKLCHRVFINYIYILINYY